MNSRFPHRRVTTAVAAEYVGLAKITLEKYRVHGGGPAFLKIGRRVVYDTRDLDTWLESHRRNSTAVGGDSTPHDPRMVQCRRHSSGGSWGPSASTSGASDQPGRTQVAEDLERAVAARNVGSPPPDAGVDYDDLE